MNPYFLNLIIQRKKKKKKKKFHLIGKNNKTKKEKKKKKKVPFNWNKSVNTGLISADRSNKATLLITNIFLNVL